MSGASYLFSAVFEGCNCCMSHMNGPGPVMDIHLSGAVRHLECISLCLFRNDQKNVHS